MTPPGQDTNPSQVSPQQKLVLVYTAELTGASQVKCLAQEHNTVVRPGVHLNTGRLVLRKTSSSASVCGFVKTS